MFQKTTSFIAVTSLIIASTINAGCAGNGSSAQSDIDMSQIMNIFDSSLNSFQAAPANADAATTEASDLSMEDFAAYTQANLNNPSFTSTPIGLELKEDGLFQGYADENNSGTRDSGEDNTFTVEVDTESNRLIGTDQTTGESSGMRFGMGGLVAGMLIGNLLNRQRRSGITPSSLSNRNVTNPSNSNGASGNKSRSTANSTNSNSARTQSFSGSHSSGK